MSSQHEVVAHLTLAQQPRLIVLVEQLVAAAMTVIAEQPMLLSSACIFLEAACVVPPSPPSFIFPSALFISEPTVPTDLSAIVVAKQASV